MSPFKRSQSIKVNPWEFPEFPAENFTRPQGWYGESKIDPRVKAYEASENSESAYENSESMFDHSESGTISEASMEFDASERTLSLSRRGRLTRSSLPARNLVQATAWVHPKKHQEIMGRPSEWMGSSTDPSAAIIAARRRSTKRPSPIKVEGYN